MTTRRLAAILAADVVGFSSMMEKDEEGTLARVKAFQREVIEPKVKERGGRLVKTTGDGFLCEFGSPVEAVRCALEVQESARNGTGESLLLRMGINLGDIIVEVDGDIYGEGVNVAARLEQLADPGGLCISGSVHEHAEGKVSVLFESRGEQQVKNIARPVRVYEVAGAAVASRIQPSALPLPTKPSIAVLPFTNMSGDPEQDYFCDGLVEDIITALSHFRGLFVIARNSSFTYKGRAVDIKQVGKELGVRYVLEGSVRRGGNRLRVTGQLIEATTGAHVWADKFEGALSEVFDLQDQITERVVGAIQPSLWEAEAERLRPRPTESLSAYELYLKAVLLLNKVTQEGCTESRALLDRAIDADPHFGLAYAVAAQCHVLRTFQGWSNDIRADQTEIRRFTRAALSCGDNDSEVLWRVAFALSSISENLERCLAIFQKALEFNPNTAHGWQWYGWCQIYAGQYAEARPSLERSRRLSPRDLRAHVTTLGLCACEFYQERFEEAARLAGEAVAQNPRFTSNWRYLVAALAQAGRLKEAEEAAAQFRALDPNASVRSPQGGILRTPKLDLYLEGLRKAGLPE